LDAKVTIFKHFYPIDIEKNSNFIKFNAFHYFFGGVYSKNDRFAKAIHNTI
jgi:hypothetical protein